jgi:hypothetical protein
MSIYYGLNIFNLTQYIHHLRWTLECQEDDNLCSSIKYEHFAALGWNF